MSETKNGLPQQPASAQDNYTSKVCPLLMLSTAGRRYNNAPCMKHDCAWYVYDPVDGSEGCAFADIAEVLSLIYHHGLPGGGKS